MKYAEAEMKALADYLVSPFLPGGPYFDPEFSQLLIYHKNETMERRLKGKYDVA